MSERKTVWAQKAEMVAAFSEFSDNPPDGSTGGGFTNRPILPGVKVDWLNLTFPAQHRLAVLDHIDDFLGPHEEVGYGRFTYRESVRWLSAGMICWTEGREEFLLSLNGYAIDQIGVQELFDLLKWFVKIECSCTRVDCAFDDYERIASMDMVATAARSYNFTGCRKSVILEERVRREVTGGTIYFGARGKSGSGRFLRVYDKNLESGGEINAIRWECVYSKDAAKEFFARLVQAKTLEEFAACVGGAVGGCIDFVDRGHETNIPRMARLSWWSKIVEKLGAVRIVVHQVTPPLQQFWFWCERCVLPGLAAMKIVVQSMGFDLLDLLEPVIDRAEEGLDLGRWKNRKMGLNISECFG